ncbi:MAG: hypothetical protein AAF580_06145 [Pseudomonadota bacterium]
MTKFTAIATAAAITLGSLTAAAPASAGSFAPVVSKNIETTAPAIEEVGRRGRHAGAAAALGIAAFATGLAVAGAATAHPYPVYRRDCYIERVRVWRPRLNAYVIRKERVCY